MKLIYIVNLFGLCNTPTGIREAKKQSKNLCSKIIRCCYFVDPINCFILLSILGSETPLVHLKRDFRQLDLCPVLCDMPAFPRFSDPLALTRKRLHTLLFALNARLTPMNRVNNSTCGDWILVTMGCRMDLAKKRNMEYANNDDDNDKTT